MRQARERAQHDQDARDLAHRAGTDQQQYYGPTYRSSDSRSTEQIACDNAKSTRDTVLKQVGLARTYDLMRQLDEEVYAACHGR
jgi:hypothetical protein